MTPLEENPPVQKKARKRRMKGTSPQRSSRRGKGEEPSVLDVVPEVPALKKLQMGGAAGRITDDKVKWSFEPKKLISSQKIDNEPDEGEQTDCTYRVIGLKEIEKATNLAFSCDCDKYNEIENFVSFCVENDSDIYEAKMRNLVEKYKRKNENVE